MELLTAPRRAALSTILAFVTLSVTAPPARSDGPSSEHLAAEAALIYEFLFAVEWPEPKLRSGEPLLVGLLGAGSLADVLERVVARKRAAGHTIEVERISDLHRARECHLLYIGSPPDGQSLDEYLERLKGAQVLTVGEEPAFNESGGIIRFYTWDKSVRFAINLEVAKAESVELSYELVTIFYSWQLDEGRTLSRDRMSPRLKQDVISSRFRVWWDLGYDS